MTGMGAPGMMPYDMAYGRGRGKHRMRRAMHTNAAAMASFSGASATSSPALNGRLGGGNQKKGSGTSIDMTDYSSDVYYGNGVGDSDWDTDKSMDRGRRGRGKKGGGGYLSDAGITSRRMEMPDTLNSGDFNDPGMNEGAAGAKPTAGGADAAAAGAAAAAAAGASAATALGALGGLSSGLSSSLNANKPAIDPTLVSNNPWKGTPLEAAGLGFAAKQMLGGSGAGNRMTANGLQTPPSMVGDPSVSSNGLTSMSSFTLQTEGAGGGENQNRRNLLGAFGGAGGPSPAGMPSSIGILTTPRVLTETQHEVLSVNQPETATPKPGVQSLKGFLNGLSRPKGRENMMPGQAGSLGSMGSTGSSGGYGKTVGGIPPGGEEQGRGGGEEVSPGSPKRLNVREMTAAFVAAAMETPNYDGEEGEKEGGKAAGATPPSASNANSLLITPVVPLSKAIAMNQTGIEKVTILRNNPSPSRARSGSPDWDLQREQIQPQQFQQQRGNDAGNGGANNGLGGTRGLQLREDPRLVKRSVSPAPFERSVSDTKPLALTYDDPLIASAPSPKHDGGLKSRVMARSISPTEDSSLALVTHAMSEGAGDRRFSGNNQSSLGKKSSDEVAAEMVVMGIEGGAAKAMVPAGGWGTFIPRRARRPDYGSGSAYRQGWEEDAMRGGHGYYRREVLEDPSLQLIEKSESNNALAKNPSGSGRDKEDDFNADAECAPPTQPQGHRGEAEGEGEVEEEGMRYEDDQGEYFDGDEEGADFLQEEFERPAARSRLAEVRGNRRLSAGVSPTSSVRGRDALLAMQRAAAVRRGSDSGNVPRYLQSTAASSSRQGVNAGPRGGRGGAGGAGGRGAAGTATLTGAGRQMSTPRGAARLKKQQEAAARRVSIELWSLRGGIHSLVLKEEPAGRTDTTPTQCSGWISTVNEHSRSQPRRGKAPQVQIVSHTLCVKFAATRLPVHPFALRAVALPAPPT